MSEKEKRKECAQKYCDLIKVLKQDDFAIEDLYAAYLSGWSMAMVETTSSDLETLLGEIKRHVGVTLSDTPK